MSNRSPYKRNKRKEKEIKLRPDIIMNYQNWPRNQALTIKHIQDTVRMLENMAFVRGSFAQVIAPGLKSIFDSFFQDWLNERTKWSKEEMAKQVELYKNIIETEFGVKLCVKDNKGSDVTSMELLVPNKLFVNDGGREKLADALQKIAMFVLSMDDPEL